MNELAHFCGSSFYAPPWKKPIIEILSKPVSNTTSSTKPSRLPASNECLIFLGAHAAFSSCPQSSLMTLYISPLFKVVFFVLDPPVVWKPEHRDSFVFSPVSQAGSGRGPERWELWTHMSTEGTFFFASIWIFLRRKAKLESWLSGIKPRGTALHDINLDSSWEKAK